MSQCIYFTLRSSPYESLRLLKDSRDSNCTIFSRSRQHLRAITTTCFAPRRAALRGQESGIISRGSEIYGHRLLPQLGNAHRFAGMYSTTAKQPKGQPAEPRPSSSIILLSHTNQVLLLRRVKTSRSFASAHVFPGGNLSEFHDGPVVSSSSGGDAAQQHVDNLAYRLGAVRETFEESGILLARKKGAPAEDDGLLVLSAQERDEARKAIYNNEVRFTEWLDSVGGIADTGEFFPFHIPSPKELELFLLALCSNFLC